MNISARLAVTAVLATLAWQSSYAADSKILARVNGVAITEDDVSAASASMGAEIAGIPDAQRRGQIVDYLVTNHLMAAAASQEKLDSGPAFDRRMQNYRRLALAEIYYEKMVVGQVSEADVKKVYDTYVGEFEARQELRARHILLNTEEEARDIVERINRGDDFAELAKEFSKGAEADVGGDIGYFAKGDMVAPFDEAVFALKVDDISEPVKTRFGWHVIHLIDKRTSKPNSVEDEKFRILAGLIQEKRDSVIEALRGEAKIEIVDSAIRKTLESPATRGSFGQ